MIFIYITFNEIIYKHSKRNILTEDYNLNLRNYREIIYDFDSIEKYLGELLLPGKVKFNGTGNLKYVTYNFEEFRGNKPSILPDFLSKYKQKELTSENKQALFRIIKDILDKQMGFENIFFSFRLLLFYLTKERRGETEEIKDIIYDLPDYVQLSKEFIDFFMNSNLKIKVEELLDVYYYIELLCFKLIVGNMAPHYKNKLEENQAKNINGLFEGHKFSIITKESLATASRLFISRYLVSNRYDNEYEENKFINFYLLRYELWPTSFIDKEDLLEQDINY